MLRLLFILILALVLFPKDAFGQKKPAPEVVITANRYPVDPKLTGRRVEVLTAEQITALPVTSVDELLRTVGGVEIQSRGGFGVQSDFSLRGSGFNGVLILIDGVRFNDPQTGHFLSDFPIPLSEIDRIEVLRGPASALYGADALGGVIQIFTKTAHAERPKADAHAVYGQHDYRSYGGYYHYKLGKTRLGGAHSRQKTDGQPIFNASGAPVLRKGQQLTTDFSQNASTFAIRRKMRRDGSLNFRTAYDNRDFSAWQYYTASPADSAREATKTWWTQASYQRNQEDQTNTFSLAYRRHQDRYVFNPATPANEHTSRQWVANATRTRLKSEKRLYTLGLSFEQRSIESNNLGNHSDISGGIFASTYFRPTQNLSLGAGARLDYDPSYGLEPTPYLNVAYNLEKIAFRGSAGRAIRAPGYTERYINSTVTNPRGRNLGNPDLKTETAWAYEGGLDIFPAKGLTLHGTFFYRDTQNLIDYTKLSNADVNWMARNLVRVQTTGIELDAAYTRKLNKSKTLTFKTSYSQLDANFVKETGIEYKYVLTNAKQQFQNRLILTNRKTQFGLSHLTKETLAGKRYTIYDARVEVRPFRIFGLKLTGEVRNLTDVQYSEIFNAPMPRRWWLIGLEY